MSEVAVMEFLKTSLKNPTLFSEITSTAEGRSEAEAGEAVAALGARQGYQFTGEEALIVRDRFLDRLNDAEGDEVLEGVSGGSSSTYAQIQVDALSNLPGLPAGSGMVLNMAGNAALGTAQGQSTSEAVTNAAVGAAQGMNDTKDSVQAFFSSVFSGW